MGSRGVDWGFGLVSILVFVLLGNARSASEHPFIPGLTLTMNLFVPVVAGRLKGRWEGLLVGFLGPLVKSFSPAGTVFDLLNVFPYAFTGFLAGSLARKYPTPVVALSIIPGRLLSLSAYSLFGLVPEGVFTNPAFWASFGFVVYIGVVLVMFMNAIYTSVEEYRR
jgi:hypothetical protein